MVAGFFDIKHSRRSETLRRDKNKLPEYPLNPMAFLLKHNTDIFPEDQTGDINPNQFKIIFVSLHCLFTQPR